MPAPLTIQQNVIISNDCDTVVQTDLSGSTVYSLPKWSAKRSMVDVVLMIMDEDGPMPMNNMRLTKKTRNAADQFYDEHQGEYEARGQPPYDQINRVHTHNNAYPKMYDELDKRRSIAQVGMTGIDTRQTALHRTEASSKNISAKFDPTCPKCIKRKNRIQEERKRKGLCKKCRNELDRKENNNNKNKVDRVTKNKVEKSKNQHSRHPSTPKVSKRSRICLNKSFQCCLIAESKNVSTFKSYDNLLHVVQESTPTNLTSVNIKDNLEKNVLKSKSSHKKRVAKKTPSTKSDVNSGNPDTETGPSVSSYNSFMSTEHEPMIE